MGCFPCFGSTRGEELKYYGAKGGNGGGGGGRAATSSSSSAGGGRAEEAVVAPPRVETWADKAWAKGNAGSKKEFSVLRDASGNVISAQTFTFRQLAAATKNFRDECFIGEGGFGRVYKGRLDTGQVVAIKQLNRDGNQGNKEFLVEVLMLSLLHHQNLVSLVGYCADRDQRLLVYEYMPLGSLEDHLHDLPPGKEPLDWNTRMKIAAGAAKGLEYLHDKAHPPVIYRDFKSSNILLGEGFHPKLSDFGLAKLGPVGDKSHVSTRVMGTYGYCAPEYAMTGQLTVKSDVYSFGVVLLELITGRKAIDSTRPAPEQNLVSWARPLFNDRRKLPKMADPGLEGRFPTRGLYQALAVASMCIQSEAASRPLIADVVTALSYLANQIYDPSLALLTLYCSVGIAKSGTQVAFGQGNSSYARNFPMPKKDSSTSISEASKIQKEYAEPWDYAHDYPVTLPLRRPYSGNPEILDEEEFGESSESRAQDAKLSAAEELGLMDWAAETQFVFFQFPTSLPLPRQPQSVADPNVVSDKRHEGMRPSHIGSKLKEIPEGYMGKILVYRSGKVKMKIGDALFDVSSGSNCKIVQEVAAISTREKHCCTVGEISKRAVITPDVNYMLDSVDKMKE